MLLITLGDQCSPVAGDCDQTPLPDNGACHGFYFDTCVQTVITGLRDTTPNNEHTYSFSMSYPDVGASGGVYGAATCVFANGVQACQGCLLEAFNYLNTCKNSASGSYGSNGCTMSFSQIG
ncbi:hypothetical protein LINPERHAP2_LOCUS10643 [Linum perenne]